MPKQMYEFFDPRKTEGFQWVTPESYRDGGVQEMIVTEDKETGVFTRLLKFEPGASGKGTRTEVYYCHPYRPSERGSNENQNGLIRRHLPKGTDLSTISYEETKRIEDWLNNYPRKMFGYLCSEQLFREEIALILAS